ncbi:MULTISPECIES: hypothetical protein [Xanthobacter]|uniref:hypothetical protein n=1 Tax=Xanthobacter TaxID=279 RepID=UPI00372D7D9D
MSPAEVSGCCGKDQAQCGWGGTQLEYFHNSSNRKNDPLMLADEPTGNLDTASADAVFV